MKKTLILAVDRDDDFTTSQYTFSGISDVYELFMLDVSSSDIRRFIAGGHAFRHLVSEPVYRYIKEHKLYNNQ